MLTHTTKGVVVQARYLNEAGELHRVGGPALLRYFADGSKKLDHYYLEGALHRDDGPAEIAYDSRGNRETEVFYDHGVISRADGPAVMQYAKGKLGREEWRSDGDLHRTDGPAMTEYFPSGSVRIEEWCVEGGKHREGGPAIVRNREDGTRYSEEWYRRGQQHRIDGPARVIYGDDGVTGMNTDGPWVLYGEYFSSPGKLAERLAGKSDAKIAKEFSQSSYAPLVEDGTDLRAALGAIGQGVHSLEGIREVLGGAPAEWVRAFEESRT